MAGDANEFEAAIAALEADGSLAGVAGPDAPMLLWTPAADRLLWTSPAAAAMCDALILDHDGTVDPRLPAQPRLQALGAGLAPRRGIRLERIRFDTNTLAPATTCACRLVSLTGEREALLTLILGPAPRLARARTAGATSRAGDAPLPLPQPVSEPVVVEPAAMSSIPPAAVDRVMAGAADAKPSGVIGAAREGGTVRFLWQTDAAGRFLFAPDGLDELVGVDNADLAGWRWEELVGAIVHDAMGEIARAFANRETWSSQAVLWRIGRTSTAIPVDFAGIPIIGRDRRVTGFRGFGLARTRDVTAWTLPDAPAHTDAEATVEESTLDASHRVGFTAADREIDDGPPAALPVLNGRSADADGSAVSSAEDFVALDGGMGGPGSIDEAIDAQASGTAAAIAPEPATLGPAERSDPNSDPNPNLSRLSTAERSAFRDIARALGARFDDEAGAVGAEPVESPRPPLTNVMALRPAPAVELDTMRVLERLPLGILIHRGDTPLFANRLLLDLADYTDVEHLGVDGGVGRLFRGRAAMRARADDGGSALALTTRRSETVPVEVCLTTVEWDGLPAGLMVVRRLPENDPAQRLRALELELRAREARIRELSSILDTATDGVIVLDEQGRILAVNRSAEALFGYDQNEVAGDVFTALLAPESHVAALDYLDGLTANGVASLLNDGREVMGRVRQGGLIPLFMTIGRIADGPERKFCAVLRDVTAFKKAEGELVSAKCAAEDASAQRSDFLANVSHEIRTPLNAIIGFAEIMLEERFGPIGNERYRDYLQDVHASGNHVVNLLAGLLDLAKIGAGRLELAFTGVNLNGLVATSVAELQPQAARQRIVMRTSFAAKLPPVVADERSIRQIMANIISNAIKFTEAGGQVIVSTAMTDRGEVAFRVRDTGVGMTKEEVEVALEPFRQTSGPRKGGGTGLGLPLTKALVGANRGALLITSARDEGTLVEVLFPPTRVLAD